MPESFKEKVIKIVSTIPHGKVLTYQEVAKKAGNANAARAVGNILNAYYRYCVENNEKTIPCHRVIRSDGKSGGYVLGEKIKEKLLEREKRYKKNYARKNQERF